MRYWTALSGRARTLGALLSFLRARRLWWMMALVVLTLLVFCVAGFLALQPPVSPFVYTMF